MDRASWLLGRSTHTDRILELGPSYRPIAPKRAGWRTYSVDHAPQSELRAKYAPLGVNVDLIEPVDSVWAAGSLHDVLPIEALGSFTRLIASHVIEHLPDLIAFFASASRLLAANGVIALAVPDRRHCFDFFRPLLTTGDVLEAHSQNQRRHTRRKIWDQAAYAVSWRGVGAWADNPVSDLAFTGSLAAAAQAYAAYDGGPDAPYIDCHAWQFTPSRFQLVIFELGQLEMINWRVVEIEAVGAEFLCILQRGVERVDPHVVERRRMEWLYQGLAETRLQIDRALGSGDAGKPTPEWGALRMLRGPR